MLIGDPLNRRARVRIKWIIGLLLLALTAAGVGYLLIDRQRERNTQRLLVQAQAHAREQQWEDARNAYRMYLRREPDNVPALSAYVDLLLREVADAPELIGEAARALQRLTQLDQKNPEPFRKLATLYLDIREYGTSEAVAAAWVELEPESVDAAVTRAAALQGLRRDEQAAEVLTQAINRIGDHPRLYGNLIRILEEDLGRPADADEWLERGLEQMPAGKEIQMAAFGLYEHRQDFQAAEQHLLLAVAAAPDDPQVLARAIRLYVQLDRLSAAERFVQIGNEENIVDRRFLLAEAEWALKTQERNHLQHTADKLAAAAKDRDFELIALAAELYLRSGRLQNVDACIGILAAAPYGKSTTQLYIDGLTGARELFAGYPYAAIPRLESALRRKPSSRWAMELLAAAYYATGAVDEAADLYRRILALHPEADATRLTLAQLLLGKNDCIAAGEQARQLWQPAEAEAIEGKLIELACAARSGRKSPAQLQAELAQLPDPDLNNTDAVQALAHCWLAANQSEHAIEVLERWLAVPGAEPAAAMSINDFLLDKQQHDLAERWAEAIIAHHPDEPEGHALLVRALAADDRLTEAEQYVANVDVPPSLRGELWFVLADGYLDCGREDLALDALREASIALPDDVAVLRGIVRHSGDGQEVRAAIDAVRHLEGERGVHWKYEQAWSILSNESANSEDLEKARSLLQECVASRAAWVSARLLMALAQELMGDLSGAAASYRTARAQRPALASDLTSVRFIEVLKQLGRFDEADAALEQLAVAAPDSTDVLRLRLDQFCRARNLDSAAVTAEKLLHHDEHDPAWIAVAADLQLRAGNAARAQSLARAGLARNPDATSLVWSLAQALVAQGQPDQGVALLGEFTERQRKAMPALLLGRLASQLGQPLRAREAVELAISLEPQNPSVFITASEFFAKAGDRDRQLQCVRDAAKLRGEDPATSLDIAVALAQSRSPAEAIEAQAIVDRRLADDPEDIKALLLRAELEARSPARLADAERSLKEALSIDPRSTPAYRALASLLVVTGRVDQAASAVATALLYRPDDPECLETAAEIEMHRGDYKRAILLLQHLLEFQPRNAKGQAMLADAFLRTGRPEPAIQQIEKSLQNFTPTAAELSLLGRLYEAAGQLDEAEDRFTRAIAADKGATASIEHARFLGRQQRFEDLQELVQKQSAAARKPELQIAIGEILACDAPAADLRSAGEKWLREIAFSYGPHASSAAYHLGLCLHRRGDLVSAETMFLKAVTISPSAAGPTNGLAWLYSEELGQPARAIELLDRFAGGGGEVTPDMHDTYAAALIRLGNYEAARHRLLKCLPLAGQSPTVSAANYRLGVLMMETGDADGGRAALRHALELNQQLGGLHDRERANALRLLELRQTETG